MGNLPAPSNRHDRTQSTLRMLARAVLALVIVLATFMLTTGAYNSGGA